MMKIATIGFTKKRAETFFGLLRGAGVTALVDTRLRPDSQLSGFARGVDLPYFCRELAGCAYLHEARMSPTPELLDGYREHKSWERYASAFTALLHERQLAESLNRAWWQANTACLLCSEHEPHRCHRRLVAEYLQAAWGDIEIVHLM